MVEHPLELKAMEHFTVFLSRVLALLAFVVLFSTGSLLKAQDVAYWTFERVDGPMAPVVKLVSVSLPELDPHVHISHSGSQLKVRIDRSVTEAVLLHKLQEATGGSFRSLSSRGLQQEALNYAPSTAQVLTKDAQFDLAAELAERPDLLIEHGLPVLAATAIEHEREAHHALVKTWLVSHPDEQSIILQTLMQNEDVE